MIDIPDVRRIIRDWMLTIHVDYDDLVLRLCDELELTREERDAARICASHLQAQVDVLIGTALALSEWKHNSIHALENMDMSEPVSLWIGENGIEVRPPVEETGRGEAFSIEATFTEAHDEN